MAELLKETERSGAKLILAGDDRQFASVSRGGMFTELVDPHGAAELKTVHRQRQAYQAKASEDFARGDTGLPPLQGAGFSHSPTPPNALASCDRFEPRAKVI